MYIHNYVGVFIIASLFSSCQYIFLFQVPWLPEFTIGLHDYRNFNAIFRGRKAVSLAPNLLSYLSLSPTLSSPSCWLQGVKNRDQFPAEVVEAYKYTFSRPGALTGPINYIRAIYKTRYFLFPRNRKTINIPTLLLWVSSLPLYYTSVSALFAKLHNQKDNGGHLCKIVEFMLSRTMTCHAQRPPDWCSFRLKFLKATEISDYVGRL